MLVPIPVIPSPMNVNSLMNLAPKRYLSPAMGVHNNSIVQGSDFSTHIV